MALHPDIDGETMYKAYFLDGSVDMYRELNQNRTLWSPTDVTTKVTQSYFIEDGSFLRCQDLTVGYTLPKNLTAKAGISRARFYVSASNLFIITGYSGYDPEVDIQTGLTPAWITTVIRAIAASYLEPTLHSKINQNEIEKFTYNRPGRSRIDIV